MLIVGYAALAVMVGDAALALLGKIPVVGALVVFAALLAGLGAMVLAIRNRDRALTATA